MPDAEELKEAIGSFRDAASLLVPELPLLDVAKLPPVPEMVRRRPTFDRRLDGGPSLDEAFAAVDRVIAPIHDLALSVFQDWMDRLANQACPNLDDNKRLVSMISKVLDRYGFRLFVERKGGLVEVRIDVKAPRGQNPLGILAQAGVFALRAYDRDTQKSQVLTDLATFPACIVARDLEQANEIWARRKGGVSDG